MSTLNSKIILAKNIALDRDYINVLNYNVNQMLQLIIIPFFIFNSF